METSRERTPYEYGLIDGQWTRQQVIEAECRSAQECLDHQERAYLEELARLPGLAERDLAAAQEHAEYMEGIITAARSSLHALIAKEEGR